MEDSPYIDGFDLPYWVTYTLLKELIINAS